MELKEGYKQTEVGVIPEDWTVSMLGDLSQIMRGGSPRPIEAYLTNNKDGYNWIKIGDVAPNAKYIFATEERIIKEGRERSRFVHKGDFLLSNSMSFGRPYILQIDGCIHDGWLVIQNYQSAFDINFLYYLLCSEQTLKQYKAKAAGSGVLNLNKELVASVLVDYPIKREQKAIASALSDVDTLLSSLDALIAKKRDIKTAAMQELVTGRRRLPGFNSHWETNKIGEILEVCHGKGQSEVESPTGSVPILASGGQIGTASKALYMEPSVLIGRKGTIDKPQYIDIPFWTIDTLFYTKIYPHNIPLFIFYVFCLIDWKQYNEASGVPSLNASTIENIEISLPHYEEQAAIATVLSDMDAEIAALEARRAKVLALKQGMMQELLTGRTRLLPEGE